MTLLALACTGEGSPMDSSPPEVEPCAEGAVGSGDATGFADCSEGICEVPAGAFLMGVSDPATPDRCPARTVELSAYALDQHEVTVAEWAACEAAGACEALPDCPSAAPRVEDEELLPATCVDWDQAVAFCDWSGGRLPTEAEWERAARGVEGATYPWGSRSPDCDYANYHFVIDLCEGGPVEVGGFPGGDSPEGFQDLAGNVFEWTADLYSPDGYVGLADRDPTGVDEGADRVLRGGAWNTRDEAIASTARAFGPPNLIDANIGLRCAYGR